jgi:putative oxidoreductase
MNTHSDDSDRPPDLPNISSESNAKTFPREEFLARLAPWVLRWALALTILSAVADRFGIWGPLGSANVSWGDWPHFVAYTAKVNSFLPGAVAPALAVMATVAEVLLGVALALGVFCRPVAWASAVLLALFAGAMTLSFGIKAPLNYSVFADAAAAFALGAWPAAPNHRKHREAICHSHNRSL